MRQSTNSFYSCQNATKKWKSPRNPNRFQGCISTVPPCVSLSCCFRQRHGIFIIYSSGVDRISPLLQGFQPMPFSLVSLVYIRISFNAFSVFFIVSHFTHIVKVCIAIYLENTVFLKKKALRQKTVAGFGFYVWSCASHPWHLPFWQAPA